MKWTQSGFSPFVRVAKVARAFPFIMEVTYLKTKVRMHEPMRAAHVVTHCSNSIRASQKFERKYAFVCQDGGIWLSRVFPFGCRNSHSSISRGSKYSETRVTCSIIEMSTIANEDRA